MLGDRAEERALIIAVSKDIVGDVASEELPLFEELVEEYLADPRPPDASRRAAGDPLGFGMSDALVAVTPAAAAMVTTAFSHILTEIFKTAKEEESKRFRERIKALIYKDKKAEPLTVEQLEQVRKVAFDQAKSFGVPENLAQQMADALTGRLALTR